MDLTLDQYSTIIAGYNQRVFDQQELAVLTGYWAGYYASLSKRKKPVKTILDKIKKARYSKKSVRATEVDVDSFLEQERRFKEKQAHMRGEQSG